MNDSANNNIPQIIEQAAKSQLGIFALMIVVLSVLVFVLFRDATMKVRVFIFMVFFIGCTAFGVAITTAKNSVPIEASTDSTVIAPSAPQGPLTNRFSTLREAATYLSAINADPATLRAAYTRDNKTIYVFPGRKDPTKNLVYTYDFFLASGKTLTDYDTFLQGPDIIPIGFDYHAGPPRFYYFKCAREAPK